MSPQRLTNLTLDGEPSDLEQDAITLEEGMKEIRYKLVELLPFIKRVRAHYASHLRGSTVVRGCKTWIQGVSRKLRVHRRVVREAIRSAIPARRKKTERPHLKMAPAASRAQSQKNRQPFGAEAPDEGDQEPHVSSTRNRWSNWVGRSGELPR